MADWRGSKRHRTASAHLFQHISDAVFFFIREGIGSNRNQASSKLGFQAFPSSPAPRKPTDPRVVFWERRMVSKEEH